MRSFGEDHEASMVGSPEQLLPLRHYGRQTDDRSVSFHAAHDKPRMQDPAALRQRAKVNLVRDEELAKFLPVRVAIVEIELADGARLSERVSAVRGTPRNPMSRVEVIDKARDLTAPILGRETADRLIETVFAIEAVTDVRSLRPLLQRG